MRFAKSRRWLLLAGIILALVPVNAWARTASRSVDLNAANERAARIRALFSNLGETPGANTTPIPQQEPGVVSRQSGNRDLTAHSDADQEDVANDVTAVLPGELVPTLLAQFPAFRETPGGGGGSVSYLGFNGTILLLDLTARVIYAAEGGRISTFAGDRRRGLLQISDFALAGPDRLVIADNSRQSLFLFDKGRFQRAIREIDGRSLFRHIQYIWTDPQSGRIGVFDSGRNRTLVFAPDGRLLVELPEKYEPVFWNGLLVRLDKTDGSLGVAGVDAVTGGAERRLFTVAMAPGRLLLDAWGAGTAGSRLVLVTYEGRQDEDHPAGGRVLLLGDAISEARPIRMNLDTQLGLRRPFATLRRGDAAWLLEAHLTEQGPAIYGFKLP